MREKELFDLVWEIQSSHCQGEYEFRSVEQNLKLSCYGKTLSSKLSCETKVRFQLVNTTNKVSGQKNGTVWQEPNENLWANKKFDLSA